MSHHGRTARLLIEQERLIRLAKRSEFIEIQPIDVQPGWPPEKYVVTFRCKGIAKISDTGAPQSSNFHQVSIYLSRDFPKQEPYLTWLTPIWHPNIEHKEPHHVCTNNVQNWYANKALDDLVVALGEMIQYKRYHAVWTQPWPLDAEAAQWVREYAEPNGIVGPNKPYDDKPILRPYEIRLFEDRDRPRQNIEPPKPKLKLGVRTVMTEVRPITPEASPEPRKRGLVLGTYSRVIACPNCGMENRIRSVEGKPGRFLCGRCQSVLNTGARDA